MAANTIGTYSVVETPGYSYQWEITGGEQISGGDSSSISVLWTNIGSGVIRVDAIPNGSCPSPSPVFLDVVIFNTFTSDQSGLWSDPTTWVGDVAPGPLADVVISPGDEVILDVDANVKLLTIEGTLTHDSHRMRVFQSIPGKRPAQGIESRRRY